MSPPLQHALREGSALLLGECPPLPLLVRGPSPLPFLQALQEERVLLIRGDPLSSVPWLHDVVVYCLVGVSPSLPWLRAISAQCWVGGPPSSSIP